MNLEHLRHYARYVVNGLALILAVLALPELGAGIPPDWWPALATVTAVLNTVLTWLRRMT